MRSVNTYYAVVHFRCINKILQISNVLSRTGKFAKKYHTNGTFLTSWLVLKYEFMLRSKCIIRISRHFKQLPLPFKRCVEIVLVCNYQLRAVSNEKFRYLNEQSNDKQNGSDNVKGTELFTKLCTLPSSSKKKNSMFY